MARLFHPNPPDRRSKYPAFVLALSYFAGLLFGVFVFRFAGDRLDSLMRGAFSGAVSIVGLLGVTVVPFLFSAFAVSLSKPALLFPVSFINAFLFCFVSLGMLCRLRRMADPVASVLQRQRVCAGAVSVLAAAPDPALQRFGGSRDAQPLSADREHRLSLDFAFLGAIDKWIERTYGYADSCWT